MPLIPSGLVFLFFLFPLISHELIQICMGFPLNCEEAQRVLRLSGAGTLYPRIQRDVCIMFALSNGYDLYMLNELLFEHGEKIII